MAADATEARREDKSAVIAPSEQALSSAPMRERLPWLLPVLALLLAGVTQAWISTPLNLVWLQLFTWAPALLVLSRLDRGKGALAGWLVGAAANASIFVWLIPTVERFTTLGWLGGVGVLVLFAAAFGFYGALFGWGAGAVRRAAGPWWPLAVPAWFVACEFLNPQLFPYFQGVAWYQVPAVFLVSSVAGISAVTFGVMSWNALLGAAWERHRGVDGADRALKRSGAVFAALLLASLVYSGVRQASIAAEAETAETTRFALVQNNIDVAAERELIKTRGRKAFLSDLMALMNETADADPDIDVFLLPESAIRGNPDKGSNRQLGRFAQDRGVEVWAGVVENRGRGEQRLKYNAGYRIDALGNPDTPYDKNILVPFGEYMPLVDLIPALADIRKMPNITPGLDPGVLAGRASAPLAFLVCYEATRFRYTRRSVAAGAELLATVTYDGWFGDTGALDQHMMLSAAASAATGVPMVRAATTGISVAVGADGVLLAASERAERTVVVVDVPKVARPSLYVRLGDWFALGCVLLGFVLVLLGERGRPRRYGSLVVPALFLLAATLTWQINPHVGALEKTVWLIAVALLAAVPGWAWRRTPGLTPGTTPAAPPAR